jgi:Alpha-2-macroglobulin family
LKIAVPSESVEPKENIQLTVETKPHSLVGLLAIDQSITFLGTGNIITRDELKRKLSVHAEVDYPFELSLKRHKDLVKLNTFILTVSKGAKHRCSMSDNALFESQLSSQITTGLLKTPVVVDKTFSRNQHESIRKYFPDMWIYENFEVNNETTIINRPVPDTITSWIINGFSINKDFGFAISDPASVTVFKEFFVHLELPYSVNVNEEVDIPVIVFNYHSGNCPAKVILFEDQGFEILDNSQKQVYVPKSSASKVVFKILVKSGGQLLKIQVKASCDDLKDEIVKTIKSNYFGLSRSDTKSELFKKLEGQKATRTISFKKVRNIVTGSEKLKVTISGSILEPALDNAENLM